MKKYILLFISFLIVSFYSVASANSKIGYRIAQLSNQTPKLTDNDDTLRIECMIHNITENVAQESLVGIEIKYTDLKTNHLNESYKIFRTPEIYTAPRKGTGDLNTGLIKLSMQDLFASNVEDTTVKDIFITSIKVKNLTLDNNEILFKDTLLMHNEKLKENLDKHKINTYRNNPQEFFDLLDKTIDNPFYRQVIELMYKNINDQDRFLKELITHPVVINFIKSDYFINSLKKLAESDGDFAERLRRLICDSDSLFVRGIIDSITSKINNCNKLLADSIKKIDSINYKLTEFKRINTDFYVGIGGAMIKSLDNDIYKVFSIHLKCYDEKVDTIRIFQPNLFVNTNIYSGRGNGIEGGLGYSLLIIPNANGEIFKNIYLGVFVRAMYFKFEKDEASYFYNKDQGKYINSFYEGGYGYLFRTEFIKNVEFNAQWIPPYPNYFVKKNFTWKNGTEDLPIISINSGFWELGLDYKLEFAFFKRSVNFLPSINYRRYNKCEVPSELEDYSKLYNNRNLWEFKVLFKLN